MDYKLKYLKYKNKYLELCSNKNKYLEQSSNKNKYTILKNQNGGYINEDKQYYNELHDDLVKYIIDKIDINDIHALKVLSQSSVENNNLVKEHVKRLYHDYYPNGTDVDYLDQLHKLNKSCGKN